MRTLWDIWDSFCNRFSNFPMNFTDEIKGDGAAKVWELTFQPLCDVTAYKPLVSKNVGTFAAPTWVTLTETTDYTIDYRTGFLTLVSPAPQILDTNNEATTSIKVTAYHMKLNLRQFVQFWNESTGQMRIFWPLKEYVKVSGTDIGKTDWDQLEWLDLTHAYWKGKTILEIFEVDRDQKHIPFRIKGDQLYFDQSVNSIQRRVTWGPTDYNRISVVGGTNVVTLPFYVSYAQNYPLFSSADPNTDLASDSLLNTEDGSETNMVMRIGIAMYSMREHWSERVNAATLRMSSLKDIQSTKMSLSQDLMRHTGDNAPGRGNTPPTTSLQ